MTISSVRATDAGLPDAFGSLWRWKMTIAVPAVVGLLAAFALYETTPRRYTSQTVLVMDLRRLQVLPDVSVVAPLSPENPVIKTELDIIASQTTADEAAKILAKSGLPIRSGRVGNPVMTMFAKIYAMAGAAVAETTDSDPVAPQGTETESGSIADLLSGLRVTNDGSSYTIFIEYNSSDPAYSATAANAFAQAYLGQQVALYDAAAERAGEWLKPRVESLRAQLEAAERRFQTHRRTAGLNPDGAQTMATQRLLALNTELVKVRGEIAEAQARRESAADSSVENAGLQSSLLDSLFVTRAELERDRSRMVEQGALRNKELATIELDLASIERQVQAERDRVNDRLAKDVGVARRKQAMLETEISQTRAMLDANQGAMIEAAQLEREVEATSAIYESFLTRYKEAIEQNGIATADARVISAAEPGRPEGRGRLAKWLMAGVAFGGFIGGTGAITRSTLAARLARPDDIDAEMNASVLGFVPPLGERGLRRSLRAPLDADSAWSRAMAQIHANARLALATETARVLAVTSRSDGDGKSSLAIGLAQAACAAGERVLLIDADPRGPGIFRKLGLSFSSTDISELEGSAALDRAAGQNAPWGADLLKLQSHGAPSAVAWGGKRLNALLSEARARYERIIIDTPSTIESPDAMHLVAAADSAIHVLRWRHSRREDLADALEQLGPLLRGRPVGIVFTRLRRGPCRLHIAPVTADARV